jgi:formylglycine-generating enzyme required for sulfatase activity
MRAKHRVVLAAVTVAAASGSLASAAPPPREATPPPVAATREARAEDGVAVLRAEGGDMVLLRAGTFTMGSIDFNDGRDLCREEPRREDCEEELFSCEEAAHEVWLDDYWIDRTEVTVARYKRCVEAGRCTLPPYADGGERFDRPDYPVVMVSWNDAQRFCTWAGGRLPTEAEWERAARGLTGRRFPWGNVYNPFLSNHGVFGLEELDARDGFLELAPVGSYPDGRTPEGIVDLAGNVQEWVYDWFAREYPSASAANPRGPETGDVRVVRGGGYHNGRAWLRGAARDHLPPGFKLPWVGFRCVREARPRL